MSRRAPSTTHAALQRSALSDGITCGPTLVAEIIYAQLNLTTTYVLDRQANRSQAQPQSVWRDAS